MQLRNQLASRVDVCIRMPPLLPHSQPRRLLPSQTLTLKMVSSVAHSAFFRTCSRRGQGMPWGLAANLLELAVAVNGGRPPALSIPPCSAPP